MIAPLTTDMKVGGSIPCPAEPATYSEEGHQLSVIPGKRNHKGSHIERKDKNAASISLVSYCPNKLHSNVT